jgi:uncharacterized protein
VAHEHEADGITREVLLAVRRTFITPFDRGDIKDLITSMDDAIDQMHQTAKTIPLFEVRSFEPAMREMGEFVVQAMSSYGAPRSHEEVDGDRRSGKVRLPTFSGG